MQSLACSVHVYFPTRTTSPSSLTLYFLGASSQVPCPGRGAGRIRRCPWRSRSSKGGFVPACKGRAASSAHILTITLPALKSICARRCGPWSLSLNVFFLGFFLLCLYKSENWQLFFHLKNHTYRQRQAPFFAYRWLKFLAASSPLKLISSSMQAKMHLHTLLVVISVIKCL